MKCFLQPFHIGKDLNKENIFEKSNLAETFGAMALSEQCAQFIFDNVSLIEDEKLAAAALPAPAHLQVTIRDGVVRYPFRNVVVE